MLLEVCHVSYGIQTDKKVDDLLWLMHNAEVHKKMAAVQKH